MTRIECTECHDLIDTTANTVVLPFICGECQKAPELLAAMAPAKEYSISDSSTGHVSKDWRLSNSDKLYEYLFNKVSDFDLRAVFSRLTSTIPTLSLDKQPDACDSATIENTTLLIEDQANQLALALNEVDALRQVNQYLEAREAELVTQNDRLRENIENLTHERDVWQKRALLAKRCYDQASSGRRYYRGKLRDAGIKA